MRCFVNATAHPSRWWSPTQHAKVLEMSGADYIVDEPFPRVDALSDWPGTDTPIISQNHLITCMAYSFSSRILQHKPVGVLLQGYPVLEAATAKYIDTEGVKRFKVKGHRQKGKFVFDSLHICATVVCLSSGPKTLEVIA